MRELFPYNLRTMRLFCRSCQKVTDHDILARDNYTTYGGLDSHIPLLCSCQKCQTLFVAFSHEFAFCKSEQDHQDYTKIYGSNRVSPGSWLYFKGTPKPGIVKSFFQGPEKEMIVISYDGGPDQKVECPKVVVDEEEAPEGYRLLPAQSAAALFGDFVYHTIRDQFGVVVGLVNDGEKDKLVVLLKDNTLVFITLPSNAQNMPNDRLDSIVRSKLLQVFPGECKRITIDVAQGTVFLNGYVRNLSIKRAVEACVNGLPHVRGCVDFMRIQDGTYVADGQVEKNVLALVESPVYRIFDYEVKVISGKVSITGSSKEGFALQEFENKIAEIQGVTDLNCSIKLLPAEEVEYEKLCKEIETDLALNTVLQGTFVRVSFVRKKFLLEGFVHSAIQKRIAFMAVVKKVKSPLIDNRLKLK